jgi:F-type H+-transporting ATPase subunit delta
MAESLTIARPYAEAVFKLARESNTLPSWSDALARLAAVASNGQARELIGNPKITDLQMGGLVADTAGLLSPEQKNFVQVLAENERLSVLPEIAGHFEALRSTHDNIVDAQVSSAYPLTDAQLADVVETLKSKYGKQVKATVHVDPELIGGVSIRVGDEVLDASVRGKLAQLAGALKV